MLVKQQNISSSRLFTLQHNQSLRLPQQLHELQILSGSAWLTIAGQDIILNSQQVLSIPKSKYGAVISAISEEPLIFELQ
ncbi:MAG TPA: hypothetical protein VK184_13160 [Nostocaceae cyanobacterium]|nr:hypothetical protein [Nostocaceae cyanobacterium]